MFNEILQKNILTTNIRIYIIVFDYIFFGKTYVESKDARYRVLMFIENKNNSFIVNSVYAHSNKIFRIAD